MINELKCVLCCPSSGTAKISRLFTYRRKLQETASLHSIRVEKSIITHTVLAICVLQASYALDLSAELVRSRWGRWGFMIAIRLVNCSSRYIGKDIHNRGTLVKEIIRQKDYS